MVMTRLLKHLFIPDWIARRPFPPAVLRRIGEAIRASESKHRGELRFAIEAGLHLGHLRMSPRQRARQVFAELGVWDTEENSGVLVYVQLVDRKIEIVTDRGIAKRVEQSEWEKVCRTMERSFKEGRFEAGAIEAIESVTEILTRHFPARGANPNELPDKPVVL